MNEENKENNMSENMIENTGKKQTEYIQSGTLYYYFNKYSFVCSSVCLTIKLEKQSP